MPTVFLMPIEAISNDERPRRGEFDFVLQEQGAMDDPRITAGKTSVLKLLLAPFAAEGEQVGVGLEGRAAIDHVVGELLARRSWDDPVGVAIVALQ